MKREKVWLKQSLHFHLTQGLWSSNEILSRLVSQQTHFCNKYGKCNVRLVWESITSALFPTSQRNQTRHGPIYRPRGPENQSICSFNLKREQYHRPHCQVAQYRCNFFLANIIKTYFTIMERLWFITGVQKVFSIRNEQKGTLGNFMIHDETSRMILNVCLCHCILIMASVQWRHQYTS